MEVAKKRETANRIHGTSAYAYAHEAIPKREGRQAPKEHTAAREKAALNGGVRFSMLICILMVSFAGLAVVSRFSGITSKYSDVNDLRSEIESVNTRIRTLNVALECAVNIKEVQETAKEWGMTYPTAEQYVRAGDPLPQTQNNSEPDIPGQSELPEDGG